MIGNVLSLGRHSAGRIVAICLAIVAVLCLIRLEFEVAALALSVTTAACCAAWLRHAKYKQGPDSYPLQRFRKVAIIDLAKQGAIIFACVVVAVVALRTYYWMTWNPTANAFDSGWGWRPRWLPFSADMVAELPAVPNGKGAEASIRRVLPGLLMGSTAQYFVHVRKIGEHDSADNLVFRYQTSTEPLDIWPIVTWATPSVLRISIDPGNTATPVITAQRQRWDGVDIDYSLPTGSRQELQFWQRPIF